ncbi:CinA family protein, partial [Streptomyces albidochromogenes]|uniref:CinA family protein n=1 Tax=Streptomyces albidochromogenes TaxID=329524 RepID=UPI00110F8DEC
PGAGAAARADPRPARGRRAGPRAACPGRARGARRRGRPGARRVLKAAWGIATTGVAGPDAQDGQPVGTVFVAVAGPGGAGKVARLRLNGDRAVIRMESVRSVLTLLSGELNENARAQDTEQNGGN